MPTVPKWWPDWTGQTAAIVASGPSAGSAGVGQLQGRCRVIAVNSAWKLAPWADAIFGADAPWWRRIGPPPGYQGLRLSSDIRAVTPDSGVLLVECRKGIDLLVMKPRGRIGWGGNSAFQALNLACQWGAVRILLVGVDATLEHGIHFHGPHPETLGNPTRDKCGRWRRAFDNAAPELKKHGITVVNCSPISRVTAYPKLSIAEALCHSGTGLKSEARQSA